MNDHKPWKPVEYDSQDVSAIQALASGTANEGQQKQALKWIIERAGCAYDMTYYPGEDGRRDTDFAEGRRFVANQIIKLTKLPLSKVREQDERK